MENSEDERFKIDELEESCEDDDNTVSMYQ